MKKLFIYLLLIMPLLMLSQVSEKHISKNNKGNWEIDQTTAEASYYAIIERDSLIAENNKLRQRITNLEVNNNKLIDETIKLTEALENQLLINQEATTNLNNTNDELISVWRKLYKGAKLNANLLSTTNTVFYAGLNLSAPIDLKWRVSVSALYGLNTGIQKPSYLLGLSYNIF